jgi:tetratricopeptide (TPR) repeat protein
LADTYYDDVLKIVIPADKGIGLAREAIGRALALDPESGAAHAALGGIALDYDLDLAAAARRLERAMALEPSNPDIIGGAAALSRRLGRLDQAIALGKYQMALDPVNADGRFGLGLAYRYAGHLDEALVEFRTVLSLTPGRAGLHETIGGILLQKGDAQAALAEIQQERADQWRLPALSVAYHALGRKTESDAALDELIRKYGTINAEAAAAVFAFRGEADRAFEWLDKAADNQEPGLTPIAAYPWYASIHSDPRWLPFLRRIGIAPEQLAAIEFDVKLPE